MDNNDWTIEGPYNWTQHCCGPQHRGDRKIKQKHSWRHPLIMGSYCWDCRQLIKITTTYRKTA